MRTPNKLYKYCAIGVNSLRNIMNAEVYHSSPRLFNDPLDCAPSLQADIPGAQLFELVNAMLTQSGMDGEELNKHLDAIGVWSTVGEEVLTEEQYREAFARGLAEEVKRRIQLELGDQGVLSLSEKWDEPLMWSHYADQHQGFCIEYDTTGFPLKNLKPVNYNASRSISANDIYQWKCNNDEHSKQRVIDTFFYAKAPQWRYEMEWRDVSERAGVNVLHFDISAIYFGMRADPVWKWMVVQALRMEKQVGLYEVLADDRTFELRARPVAREVIEKRSIATPPFRAFANMNANLVRDLRLGADITKAGLKP